MLWEMSGKSMDSDKIHTIELAISQLGTAMHAWIIWGGGQRKGALYGVVPLNNHAGFALLIRKWLIRQIRNMTFPYYKFSQCYRKEYNKHVTTKDLFFIN